MQSSKLHFVRVLFWTNKYARVSSTKQQKAIVCKLSGRGRGITKSNISQFTLSQSQVPVNRAEVFDETAGIISVSEHCGRRLNAGNSDLSNDRDRYQPLIEIELVLKTSINDRQWYFHRWSTCAVISPVRWIERDSTKKKKKKKNKYKWTTSDDVMLFSFPLRHVFVGKGK